MNCFKEPIIRKIHYEYWDAVLACKNMTRELSLSYIWTECYDNFMSDFNYYSMVKILKNIIEEIYTKEERTTLFVNCFNAMYCKLSNENINDNFVINYLVDEIIKLKVKENGADRFIIEKDNKFFTIDEYFTAEEEKIYNFNMVKVYQKEILSELKGKENLEKSDLVAVYLENLNLYCVIKNSTSTSYQSGVCINYYTFHKLLNNAVMPLVFKNKAIDIFTYIIK